MNFDIKENVKGTNLANELTKNELKNLLPQLEKYVGQRILITTGKSAKFNYKHLEQKDFRCYLDISTYGVWFKADAMTYSKADKNGVCCTSYWNKAIFIGNIENGILKSVDSYESILSGYGKTLSVINEGEQIEIKNKYQELKKQLEQIESKFLLNKELLKY